MVFRPGASSATVTAWSSYVIQHLTKKLRLWQGKRWPECPCNQHIIESSPNELEDCSRTSAHEQGTEAKVQGRLGVSGGSQTPQSCASAGSVKRCYTVHETGIRLQSECTRFFDWTAMNAVTACDALGFVSYQAHGSLQAGRQDTAF